MTATETLTRLQAVIEADQQVLPPSVQKMAQAIRDRHGDAVRALVFYGSAMRETDDPEKMFDFYVIVDSYSSIYPNLALRFATGALPPGVHFVQIDGPSGRKMRSKYAVISEDAFCHRTAGGVLESMLWARFVQPSVILTDDPRLYSKLRQTFARACLHFYQQAAPLIANTDHPEAVWVRGLAESYRTELRPETPHQRAQEIVSRYPERYAQLTEILNADKSLLRGSASYHRFRWAMRRVLGKPRGIARILKGALTFDAGLDYILEKVGNHSGVHLQVSDRARRHPVLFAPMIAWRLYRAGAFR